MLLHEALNEHDYSLRVIIICLAGIRDLNITNLLIGNSYLNVIEQNEKLH